MRLSFIFIFAALMQVSASTKAQRITLTERNTPLKEVLKKIKLQSGMDIFYADYLIKQAKKVTVNINDLPLTEALDKVLEDQRLNYEVKDKTIVLKREEPSFLDRIIDRFAAVDVRGRVLDEAGNPLVGATIQVKGKALAYKTKENGEFEIKGVDEDAVLLVSYVGFKTLEIALKDAVLPLDIKLNVATGELEEVNVTYSTGYENIPKERATGSFVQLNSEDINRSVSANILDRIINITGSLRKGNSDSPQGSDITIRGLSTINANQKPLIVIDGFPYEESEIGGSKLSRNLLENLNPNDVESITILRDAAAASIWGARSGNGVIVITTKKGKYNQNTNVQFNSSLNLIERPNLSKLNIASSSDIIEYEQKTFASGIYDSYNGPFVPNYSYPVVSPAIEIMLAQKRGAISQNEANLQLKKLATHDVRDDINKYLLRNGSDQLYNLNLSGGSEKMNFYTSVGYNKNLNSSIGNENSRISLRADNTYRPIKNLELNSYIVYTQSQVKNNAIDYLQFVANGRQGASPYLLLADAQGNPLHSFSALRTAYIDTISTKGLLDWHYRPLEELNNNDNTQKLFNARLGGRIKYTILQGLSLNLSGQYERGLTNLDNYYNVKNYRTRDLINKFMFLNTAGQPQYPIPLGGILEYSNQIQSSYNLRAQINLNKKWGRHAISVISGADIRESDLDYNLSRKYGYDPLTLGFSSNMDYKSIYALRPLGNSSIQDFLSLQGKLNRFLSYYSNVGYTLKNKYTVTASGRIDASNFFGIAKNLKSVPLWSIGASWDINKEDFFRPQLFSNLRIRATYGYNGNTDNTATSLPTIGYRNGTSAYNNSQQFATRESPPNPGLSWETVKIINIALDFGFLNNRINGSVEYYNKNSVNLIGSTETDPISGVSSFTGNYANMKGHGLDLSLNGLFVKHDFQISTSLNLSYNTDKITKYFLPFGGASNAGQYLLTSLALVGKPLNKIYSYRWAGLDGATGAPMGIVNGQVVPFNFALGSTGSTTNTKPEDLVYHGPANPTFFGNVLNTISYKGFLVSFNASYSFGAYFRRSSLEESYPSWGFHSDYSIRWKKPGDEANTNVPSIPTTPDTRFIFYKDSEILVEKADHIRIQDIRISYDFNKSNIRRFVRNASFFIVASNLNIILWRANNSNIDPLNPNNIPSSRSLAFGLTLNY